jgi:hypothetical protein
MYENFIFQLSRYITIFTALTIHIYKADKFTFHGNINIIVKEKKNSIIENRE